MKRTGRQAAQPVGDARRAGRDQPGILTAKWMRILLWICLLATAVVIFLFSAQDGQESSETSGMVVEKVVMITHPDFQTLAPPAQASIWERTSFVVRKCAHFLEYAALGFFLRLLAASYGLRFAAMWAWLSGTLYAGTDELHQLFSDARSGMWQDVALDSAGVLFGGAAALALLFIASRAAGPGKCVSE